MNTSHQQNPSESKDTTANGAGRFVWILYLILLILGIPWYWPADSTLQWFGIPAWVMTSVLASLGASIVTAWYLQRPWPGETDSD